MFKLLLLALVVWAGWYFLIRPGKSRRKSTTDKQPRVDRATELREARALLGVGDEADEAAIRAAHRRLVSAVHPDKGGSAELTRRINAARDMLLRH